MSAVRKAVIPAAGLGTRFLPATKAVPKEMLPLVDKPALQWVVEEAAAAAITDVLVVTGRQKTAMEDHFDRAPGLEAQLAQQGKADLLAAVRLPSELVDLAYVRQGEALGLGHAVGKGRTHVGQEPFVVLLPDDIVHPGVGLLGRMVAAYEERGASVIALMEYELEEISAYGAVGFEPVADGLVRIRTVVEKPAPADAPSRLGITARYLFTPAIFDCIDEVKPGVGGELQLTDAIALLLEQEEVYGLVFSGGRYDVGKKVDWLRATVELALERDDLGPALAAHLRTMAAEGRFD